MTVEKVSQGGQRIQESGNGSSKLVLEFLKSGWGKKKLAMVEGKIPVAPGSKKYWKVSGKWTESMKAFNEATNQEVVVWQGNRLPAASDWNYFFSDFGINLNHLPPRLESIIAPTDCRFRQDQQMMENGKNQDALKEKARLEDK